MPFTRIISEMSMLYEVSMSIGRSLDPKENCESFLFALMGRKNFNSAWIFDHAKNELIFSFPNANVERGFSFSTSAAICKDSPCILDVDKLDEGSNPFEIFGGSLVIFPLWDKVYLFLHHLKKIKEEKREMNQLMPLVEKFSFGLRASIRHRELRLEEANLSNLIAELPAPLVVCRQSDLQVTSVNQKAIETYQYTEEQFLELRLHDLIILENPGEIDYGKLIRNLQNKIWPHKKSTGESFYVEIDGASTEIANEKYYILLINDVSGRVTADLQKKISEAKFRDLFENSSDLIQSVNSVGAFQYVNPQWKKELGYSDEELSCMHLMDVIHPDYAQETAKYYDKYLKSTGRFTLQTAFLAKDGRKILVEGKVYTTTYGSKVKYVRGIFRNVTNQKRNEEKIKESEKQYRELVESTGDIIFKYNQEGTLIYMNPSGIAKSGYTPVELKGMNFTFLVRDDYRVKLSKFFKKQFLKKKTETYIEYPIVQKNGEEFWLGQTTNLNIVDGKAEFTGHAVDITDRKKVETELKMSETKYRSILENLELGLLEVDKEERITRAYPKFCELTDYSEEELVGRNASELLLPKEYTTVLSEQNANRERGQAAVYETEILKKNGEKIWVVISGAPFYDHKGNFAGSAGIHLDITKRKKMEGELREAKEMAEKSSALKEIFTANMSHEIRTPMNAIIGMSDLLSQSELNPTQQKYLGAISTSASNLLTIINDVLDFSKIEAGKLELEVKPTNLGELIKNCIRTVDFKADEVGITLEKEIEPTGSYITDPTRLSQILLNFLSNAIKFTPENGRVKVCCKFVNRTDTMDEIEFAVSDTGIGIKASNIKSIVQAYVQSDKSTSRKYGGTGLGLSISNQLIKLLGGELKIESKINKGSVFSFRLKLNRSSRLNSRKKEKNHTVQNLIGTRILLVEDNELNQFMAESYLSQWKCIVDTVSNGQEAIDILQQKQFDVILMDIRMPVMDGLTAIHEIRDTLKLDTPIIALTANAMKGEKEKYMKAGFNSYITKPFDKIKLHQVIESFSHRDAESTTKEALMDLSKLDKSTGGNMDFKMKMIDLFLRTMPDKLLQMNTLLDQGDFVALADLAHQLKPSIDHFANTSLREEVRQLEDIENYDRDKYRLVRDFCAKTEEVIKEVSEEFESIRV